MEDILKRHKPSPWLPEYLRQWSPRIEFSQEPQAGRRNGWSPATARRQIIAQEDFSLFWSLVNPLAGQTGAQAVIGQWRGDHTPCLVRRISYLLFKSNKPGRTLRVAVGIANPSHLFSFQSHWINLFSLLYNITCLFNWPVEDGRLSSLVRAVRDQIPILVSSNIRARVC